MNQVYFKYPHNNFFTHLKQETMPLTFSAIESIGEASGFIIAPFIVSDALPIVLLHESKASTHPLPMEKREASTENTVALIGEDDEKIAYTEAFNICHHALCAEEVSKVVLARTALANCEIDETAYERLFITACQENPSCYVCLFSTTLTGTWLSITPEALLESSDAKHFHTMALAGTLPASRQNYHDAAFWPAKHVREQALVAQYIRQMLQELNINVEQGSIGVKQMQQLLHLCTDFYFDLPDKVTLPQLINKLHPTPAVGGLPKAEALHLIAEAEKNERRYYAGFMGEYRQKGKTVLFVTLRCVEILAKTLIFHAGGGLLTESNAEDEWEETCRKIATIASNLH